VVCRAGLPISFRAAREAQTTAALNALSRMLTRASMEWAFRKAGFAVFGEALTGAMREAMAGALTGVVEAEIAVATAAARRLG
jgi:hypothetical protein